MNFGTSAPLVIALLGLLMGMRHATDPDHVIAVTTILSRERRFTAATRIGIVWGFGHTLTVLAVGALIIVFKIAIPTRIGLAMEFAVATVLILLGVGAAAQLIQRIALRMSDATLASAVAMRVHSHPHSHRQGLFQHSHAHPHSHEHAHGPAPPHPAQAARWSILRMTVTARLAAALAVSAGLWVVVWLAMR